jgi:hypothetical protein
VLDCSFLLRTDAFESCEPKPNFINPRCFGEDFALWLHDRMLARGCAVSEPIQEDWGWALLVTRTDHTFVVYIGVVDDSIGMSPAEWRIGVTYERATNRLRHLFRKPNAAVFASVCADLDAIISADPRFDVRERHLPT